MRCSSPDGPMTCGPGSHRKRAPIRVFPKSRIMWRAIAGDGQRATQPRAFCADIAATVRSYRRSSRHPHLERAGERFRKEACDSGPVTVHVGEGRRTGRLSGDDASRTARPGSILIPCGKAGVCVTERVHTAGELVLGAWLAIARYRQPAKDGNKSMTR